MDKLISNLMRNGHEKVIGLRNKVKVHVDQLNYQMGSALLDLKKRTSYHKVDDTNIYAVRSEDGLKLLLREEVRHVYIEPQNFPETFPVFLVLTNDIDDPYVFVSTDAIKDALAFTQI